LGGCVGVCGSEERDVSGVEGRGNGIDTFEEDYGLVSEVVVSRGL
jgi:hypothetical protein